MLFARACVLAATLLSCTAPRAQAQVERNASLIWMRGPGAAGCIEEAELVRRVEQHLGVALEQHADALVIEGRIEPRAQARGFIARLTLAGDASSTRELSSRDADCRALDDALVLVVAAAVETLAAAREDVPSEPAAVTEEQGAMYRPSGSSAVAPTDRAAQPSPAPAAPAPPPPPSRPPVPARTVASEQPVIDEGDDDADAVEANAAFAAPRDPLLALRLAIGPRLSFGLMPAAAGGGSIALLWPWSRALRLELGASLWPAGSRPTDQGDAHFQAARADVLGCPVWSLARALALVGCAGPSAGALLARGDFTATAERSSLRPLIGLMAWLFAELRLRGDDAFRLRAGVGASHELWRDRFAARDGLGREVLLHRVAAWTALAALELSAAL